MDVFGRTPGGVSCARCKEKADLAVGFLSSRRGDISKYGRRAGGRLGKSAVLYNGQAARWFPDKIKLFVTHRIARTADGADHVWHPAAVYRLAEPADMHVDSPLVDIDGFAPDLVEQL